MKWFGLRGEAPLQGLKGPGKYRRIFLGPFQGALFVIVF